MSFLSQWVGGSSLVGLDIGSHTIKLASLKPKKSWVGDPRVGDPSFILEALSTIAIPKGTIVDGEILDALTLEESLKELFTKEKISQRAVAFAISGNSQISKKISLPIMSEEEITHQLSTIASQYIPFPIEDINIDYQILPPTDAKMLDLVLVAVQKKFLENYVSVLEAADLKPVVIDTPSGALANFFKAAGVSEKALLIYIGACLTHVVVIEKGIATFSQDLLIGGNHISQHIRETLKLSFAEADALKMNCFREQHLPQETLEAVQKASQDICQKIEESLNIYANQFPNSHFEKVYLSGGSSRIVPFKDWLSQKIGLGATLLNPWQSIFYDTKKFSQNYITEMTEIMPVALGLAMRSKKE